MTAGASGAGGGSCGTGSALLGAWPNQLIKLVLGLAYFGAGYCKLAGHPLWADGYNLQAYLLSKHLLHDIDAGPGSPRATGCACF